MTLRIAPFAAFLIACGSAACGPESASEVDTEFSDYASVSTPLVSGGGEHFKDTCTPWSAPTNLGPTINSVYRETAPTISKNGLSLYFDSLRPGAVGGLGVRSIWVARRATRHDPWGTPAPLGTNINSTAITSQPNLSKDQRQLFFSSTIAGGYGDADIYVSTREDIDDDFGWGPAVNLGPNVNTAAFDSAPHYFENGSDDDDDDGCKHPQLFFTSGRPGGPGVPGDFDIYVSELGSDGTYGPAVLVPGINSATRDARSNLTTDGRTMYFYSARSGGVGAEDLWVSRRLTTSSPWTTPVNVGPTVNSVFKEQHPDISHDGQSLYFVSDRPGGIGLEDIYVSTRDCHGKE